MANHHGVHTVYGALSECLPDAGKANSMTWDVIVKHYDSELGFEKDLDGIVAPFLPVSSKGNH